jgi:MGT family glycosyltransferase
MKRALVITLPEKGHYLPLLGPAAAMERRGFEVFFTAPADVRDELFAAGASRVILPAGARPPSHQLRGAALSSILRDPVRLRGWIRELLVEATEGLIDPLREVVREVRPDVVAIDTMADAGAIAAELEGVPWVGFATSLNPVLPASLDSELLRTTRALEPERTALFRRHGLAASFRCSDVLSPRGSAVFSTEALVGPAPARVELVGPSLRGAGELDLAFAGGRPLVYVSFGSQAWHQPRRYDLLCAAAERLDLALLMAMGDLAPEYESRGLPGQIRCVEFADQLAAMRCARVAVTHGGANSVMEALAQGVPLLLSPLCNDQPHNLHFVERAGAGRGIDLDSASVDELAGCLRALLAGGPERAAAGRIADSYRRSGNDGAAALAERSAR